MQTSTITADDFVKGLAIHVSRMARHNYRARIYNERGIVVTDAEGNEIRVSYASTSDMRTCTAHVDGVGFIGGWQYPHKAQRFQKLVASINRGILYSDSSLLPKRSTQ